VRPHVDKPFTTIGLVEWSKVKALSLNPSTTKKKKKKRYGAEGVVKVVKVLLNK
jgi:hypothetical protein